MEANTATSTQVEWVCAIVGLSDMCVLFIDVDGIFVLLSSAEWSQRDLERNENVKFCRQYIVFHDDKSVVYSGASGNCTEIKGEYVNNFFFLIWSQCQDVLIDLMLSCPDRLLSKDSPSGEMKAVVRECTIKGEDKQFLEVCGCPSALSLSSTLIKVVIPF